METQKKSKYKVLPIRIEPERLAQWRKLAHWHEMSMAELIRTLMDNKVKESKRG